MKRLRVVMIAAAALAVLCTACAQKNATVDVQQLAENLAEDVTYAEPITALDAEAAERAFRLESQDIAQIAAYVGSGATVDETAVIEGTDEAAAQRLEQTLSERLDQRIADYADYKPEEVPKLENAILVRSGRYVVLCVTEDAETAQDVIDKALS